jgi:hypothetical protein
MNQVLGQNGNFSSGLLFEGHASTDIPVGYVPANRIAAGRSDRHCFLLPYCFGYACEAGAINTPKLTGKLLRVGSLTKCLIPKLFCFRPRSFSCSKEHL